MEELLKGPGGLFAAGETLRLVGVSASGLDDSPFEQMSLFDFMDGEGEMPVREKKKEEEETGKHSPPGAVKKKRLDDMMAKIRDRYGENALRKGSV